MGQRRGIGLLRLLVILSERRDPQGELTRVLRRGEWGLGTVVQVSEEGSP